MLDADQQFLRAYEKRNGAAALKAQLRAYRCERDLLDFIRVFWRVNDRNKPFTEGWPLEALCDHLMAVTDGHIKRLVINISPGSTKSLVTDVFWPAWEWGPCDRAWYRYICVSYSAHLTRRDNRRFKRVVQDAEYRTMWGDKVSLLREGEVQPENTAGGWKLATSIAGVGAGERGNRIVIDDANDPNTVESDVVRENAQFWIREVMPDRLNDLAEDVIVCIQQRTHEHDATGTLLDEAGLDYVHLCIPAEYESARHCITVLQRDPETREPTRLWEDPRGLDDEGERLDGLIIEEHMRPGGPAPICTGSVEGSPVQMRDGDLFWPARIPASKILEMKTAKGPIAYSGQYQQSPNPRGGGIIRKEWWRLWESQTFPELILSVASLDTAYKEHEEADYNALTVWGIFVGELGEPRVILTDAWRTRTDFASLIELVGNSCVKRKVDHLLIEDKSRGCDVYSEIRKEYGDRRWQTWLLDPKKLGGDKIARLTAVQPLFSGDAIEQRRADGSPTGITVWQGGLVYAPDMQYAEDVITEVERFPKGAHDDYVDTVSQFLLWARRWGEVKRVVEHQAEQRARDTYRKPTSPLYNV